MNFKDFKNFITNDKKADEQVLKDFIYSALDSMPTPTVKVNENTFIERAVIVTKSKGDLALSRLSYRPEHLKQETTRERFNNAGEPHFYGAFTDLKEACTTRYFLACEIDQSILNKQDIVFNFTMSKWKSIDTFPAVLFIFKNEFCNNDLIRSAYTDYINGAIYTALPKEQKELLELLTFEFAKPNSANDYVITNLVFDYYKNQGYQAIIYPGVQGKYRGNNIAMTPNIFDKSFKFYMGAEFCLTQSGDDIDISPTYTIEFKDDKLKYSKVLDEEMGEQITIDR